MSAEHEAAKTRAHLDSWWQNEPLAFETRAAAGGGMRFEFSSRGDRVEGWYRAEGDDARPLILLIPGSAAGASDSHARAWAESWCARGAGVACLDLPLHGARTSAKLSAALIEAASDLGRLLRDDDRKRLVAEFLRQCRSDLRRAHRTVFSAASTCVTLAPTAAAAKVTAPV